MKRAEKEFTKRVVEWLVYICLALFGSMLILIGFLLKNNIGQNVLVSIGTSFIATAILYFIVNSIIGDPFSPIMEKLRGSVEILDRANKVGLISIWKHRSDVADDHWIEKINSAHNNLDFLSYAMAFLPEHPKFEEILIRKANEGCKIRILLGDPGSNAVRERNLEEKNDGSIAARIETSLARLCGLKFNNNIEIKLHSTPLYCSTYRFDDEMLVSPHLYGLRGKSAPLLLYKKTKDGIFFSYEKHFDDIWDIAVAYDWESEVELAM